MENYDDDFDDDLDDDLDDLPEAPYYDDEGFPLPAIYDLTFFPGKMKTIPSSEHGGLTARQAIGLVLGDGPRLIAQKDNVTYFVPCLLKDAPMVGKTAQRFPEGHVGKMRSSSHVTAGAFWAFDLDDLPSESAASVVEYLESLGVLFAAYTTHSHGGSALTRMRVLLFGNQKLSPQAWREGWLWVNKNYLSGLADPATSKLYQQAGVFATDPSRADKAWSVVRPGIPLHSKLFAEAAEAQAQVRKPHRGTVLSGIDDERRKDMLSMAAYFLGVESYEDWTTVLGGIKGSVLLGDLSEATGMEMWLEASASASTEAQAQNTESRYDPMNMWERWDATQIPATALVGKLLAKARDKCEYEVYLQTVETSTLDDFGKRCLAHLCRFHTAKFDEYMSWIGEMIELTTPTQQDLSALPVYNPADDQSAAQQLT